MILIRMLKRTKGRGLSWLIMLCISYLLGQRNVGLNYCLSFLYRFQTTLIEYVSHHCNSIVTRLSLFAKHVIDISNTHISNNIL